MTRPLNEATLRVVRDMRATRENIVEVWCEKCSEPAIANIVLRGSNERTARCALHLPPR